MIRLLKSELSVTYRRNRSGAAVLAARETNDSEIAQNLGIDTFLVNLEDAFDYDQLPRL
jgi:hypothetical protein